MVRCVFPKLAVTAALTLGLACITVPSTASIWIGSQNCLHLGQNDPSGANQASKKTTLKNQFATNKVNTLQEVMVTSEVANVTPGSYFYKVSGLKGNTSYKEAYGFVYSVTASGSIVDYTGAGFERPPSGLLLYTVSSYAWFVDYHATFDASPNALEIQALNAVYNFYKGRSSVNSVYICGDYNRTATSTYFNNLKATGCNSILPNDLTSINSTGGWANPYDHFCWNPTYSTAGGPARESIDPVTWRTTVSDHAGIYMWVSK